MGTVRLEGCNIHVQDRKLDHTRDIIADKGGRDRTFQHGHPTDGHGIAQVRIRHQRALGRHRQAHDRVHLVHGTGRDVFPDVAEDLERGGARLHFEKVGAPIVLLNPLDHITLAGRRMRLHPRRGRLRNSREFGQVAIVSQQMMCLHCLFCHCSVSIVTLSHLHQLALASSASWCKRTSTGINGSKVPIPTLALCQISTWSLR